MPFRAIGRGLRFYERYTYLYLQANLVFVVLCLPVVTAPAAYGAMIHMANVAHKRTFTSFAEFWEAFRYGFRRSLILGVLNAVFFIIIYVNFSYFASQQTLPFVLLRVVWTILLILWTCMQIYVWPLLELMDPADPILALRNAALMVFANPVFSLVLLAVVLAAFVFSSVLVAPLLLFFFGLLANVSLAAARNRLGLETEDAPPV